MTDTTDAARLAMSSTSFGDLLDNYVDARITAYECLQAERAVDVADSLHDQIMAGFATLEANARLGVIVRRQWPTIKRALITDAFYADEYGNDERASINREVAFMLAPLVGEANRAALAPLIEQAKPDDNARQFATTDNTQDAITTLEQGIAARDEYVSDLTHTLQDRDAEIADLREQLGPPADDANRVWGFRRHA